MTLYVDVLFAINFSMDFLALFLTQMLMNKKIHRLEIIIASIIGAAYGVVELLVNMNVLLNSFINVLVSFLICFIAFKVNKIGKFTAMLIVFWATSATLGGLMSLLYSFLNKIFLEYIKNYSYSTALNGARFFIIVILSVIFALIFSKIEQSKMNVKEVDVSILYKNQIFKMKGLCDSGNLLTEPFSGKSVILVSNKSPLSKAINQEDELKKRLIPYKTVEKSGLLNGIIPPKILINEIEVSAVVAPSENDDFSGYDALVPISLI